MKLFCNKCTNECTDQNITLPEEMHGGYFILWQLFNHNERNAWHLCQNCIDSFKEDIDIFLKKQGYEIEDFGYFKTNCKAYFDLE